MTTTISADQTPAIWSLVTITGTISSKRVKPGKDGTVRFSIHNDNGYFYTQCRYSDLNRPEVLIPGARVTVTGRLVSYFNRQLHQHQVAIWAQSLAVITSGQTVSLLHTLTMTGSANSYPATRTA